MAAPLSFAAPSASTFVEKQLALGKKSNSLINEQSPYLLQHAFNPVDWMPWGEEAFARAKKENKPIFLSIGYSTCHWCHVMAHESFEDDEIAAYLNSHFICIKVDREERPDVDRIYMAATQAISGGGGWPMSVFLTADRKPFYAGTYFPPRAAMGRHGFLDLLQSINTAWQQDPSRIMEGARSLNDHLQTLSRGQKGAVELTVLDKAFAQQQELYDKKHAGFGPAPKFPRPVVFNFLLRWYKRTGDTEALDMTLDTLRQMAQGGMYDLLGGGFHRYSVDDQWRVPHFEKMLYDQAQLAVSYFEAYQLSGDPFFLRIGKEVLDYVRRDMTDEKGGFYSAEDADSQEPDNPADHGEGAFYTWKAKELKQILGDETAEIFSFLYGVQPAGNALADPLHEFQGKNIFYQAGTVDEASKKFTKGRAEIEALVAEARQKLFAERGNRPRPHLDDKVICSWNGLMISAFAKGYQITRDGVYLESAKRAADFILATLYDPKENTLLRRYRNGEAGLGAQLDDYAFFVQGLLDLYQVCFENLYLQKAILLTGKQLDLFEDREGGGFFETTGTDATLLVRMKNDYDGAEPAANSVAAMNLLRLAPLGFTDWHQKGEETIFSLAGQINRYPLALPQMLAALDFHGNKPRQVVIAGNSKSEDTEKMIATVHSLYLPNTIVLLADGGEGQAFLAKKMPSIAALTPQGGRACAYVCQNFTCSMPTTDVKKLLKMLAGS
ncbi:MAG: thioredoxin domain-containing protein [Desulfobulbaceae bacterium]|nr:thioredoxin domain-containing protein [Desulfobulbaceae bacterium]